METETIFKLPLELFAFMQFIQQAKIAKKKIIVDRRKAIRRVDRRLFVHRRKVTVSIEDTNKRRSDRRDVSTEKRRQDRRALERIKKI